MSIARKHLFTVLAAFAVATASVSAAAAQEIWTSPYATTVPLAITAKYYNWMSTDVSKAWTSGYFGQGTTITMVDDFSSSNRFSGNLNGTKLTQRHGEWTRLETSLIATQATFKSKDFNTTGTAVTLYSGLNVINLSYGMYAKNGYSSVLWGRQEASIISYAKNGQAVISKAAGNDSIAVGTATSSGQKDYLDSALIGAQSAIFAGALNSNGTTTNKASMAYYSNTAGTDVNVQNHFLVVGVDGSKTGLYGTSFAAPVISAYASVIGSKFKTATPTQITNQLLNTARTDTLLNYSATTYGRGEACLSCALAPVSIH